MASICIVGLAKGGGALAPCAPPGSDIGIVGLVDELAISYWLIRPVNTFQNS